MFFVLSPALALEGLSVVGEAGKSVINENRAASVRDMKVGDQWHRHGGRKSAELRPKEYGYQYDTECCDSEARLAAIAILVASHAIGPQVPAARRLSALARPSWGIHASSQPKVAMAPQVPAITQ